MIIALSGPSGIGKGFLKESIMAQYPSAGELVWYTTRALRPNEFNRKSVTDDEFDLLLNDGKMALVQNMFGHRYGIALEDLSRDTGVWLTEVHPYVVDEAKRINPQIITIGLMTEDIGLLRERLVVKRKTESPEEIEVRLSEAEAEMNAIRENPSMFDEVIVVTRETEEMLPSLAQEFFAKYWKEGE